MSGPDVFALLSEDHRNFERLFQQFHQNPDNETALQICDEVTVHALAEEELLYPILATKVHPGHAREARQEHQQAKSLISQIEGAIEQGGDVASLVSQLEQAIEHHVQEEETEVFPKIREAIPTFVESIGQDVVERKKALHEQLREAREAGHSAQVLEHAPRNN